MRQFIGIFFMFAFYVNFSQTYTISGYVSDAETGEKLIGTNIYDLNLNLGTSSNNYGFYSLSVPKNTEINLLISYIGYKTEVKKILADQNIRLNFELSQDNELEKVVIVVPKEKPIEKRSEIGVLSIPIQQIKMLPALGGETDVIKAFQLMPGVQSGNEGSSNLFVRGGSPDQNLILLDDVPLYYVNHLGGFVSIFNTDAIKNVKLIKGGFPAFYGNRLSSIVDIRMKEGDMKKFHGNFMIGVIAAKVSVEGPINKKTSYFFSARRMLYDLLMRPISYFAFEKVMSAGYYFYDLNAKINHRLSDKNHLFLSLYAGDDHLGVDINGDLQKSGMDNNWGNQLASVRWNHLFNSKLFMNTTLSYTRYRYKFENDSKLKESNDEYFNAYKSTINDFSLKNDWEYYPSPNYKLKFGVGAVSHRFQPGVSTYRQKQNNSIILDTLVGNYDQKSFEFYGYIENKIKIGKRITANIGLRNNNYYVNGKEYHSIEPRVLFNILLAKNLSVKAAYSKMEQNLHLLTSTGLGMPIDLWLPATERASPEKSEQYTLGIAKTILKYNLELSVEAYYKSLRNLITYKPGATYMNTSERWENKILDDGKGKSYGLEILLQKKQGRSTGWISYTLAKTTRQFDQINGGEVYPFKYDRRHDFSIVYNYKIKKKYRFFHHLVFRNGICLYLSHGKILCG